MKVFSYAVGFDFIGLLIGVLTGIGETRYYKKSQRETPLPVAVILCGTVGVVIGIVIGIKVGDDEVQLKKSGLDTASTDFYKQGRYWKAETLWTDPKTGQQASISTEKNHRGELESSLLLNGVLHSVRHEVFSGSQVNVNKAHQAALKHYFQKIKDTA